MRSCTTPAHLHRGLDESYSVPSRDGGGAAALADGCGRKTQACSTTTQKPGLGPPRTPQDADANEGATFNEYALNCSAHDFTHSIGPEIEKVTLRTLCLENYPPTVP